MKWRGILVVLMIVSLVGVTTLAQGVNVCPAGNVKYEIGGGYEYNDGSGWVEASEDRACWGANEGYGVTGVCIYVGGPDNEERLINLGPGDGCWDNPEKYGISHVVLYTEAILEPTPTDTPVEPTPTIVEPTPTEVPPEPTPTDTPPEPTPTDTPVEPTPTIVEPTPTEVPPEPTPTDTPPEPKETEVPTPNGLPSTGGQPGPNRPLSLMVVILAGGVSLAFFVLRRRKT
jgi:hypothetical protein